MRHTPVFARLSICLITACAGNRGEIGVYSTDAGEFGGDSAFVRADGAPPSSEDILAVIHSAQGFSLCSGQCTTLTAQASLGSGLYDFSWDNGLPDGPGPFQVCPSEPTTYTVRARDNSSGEFKHGDGVSSITLTPSADCAVPVAPSQAVPLCSARFALDDSTANVAHPGAWPMIANAADGSVLVTSSFRGTVQIGDRTSTSLGQFDGFVTKLDSACNPLWTKQFGAPNSEVVMNDIVVDAQGRAYVGGTFHGTIDIGAGSWTSTAAQAFVAGLDANGNTVWARHFTASSADRITEPPSLHMTPTGDLLLYGTAPVDVDFGGGPLSASNATIVASGFSVPNIGFVVGLAAETGAHHFTHATSAFSAVSADETGAPVLLGQPYIELVGPAIRDPMGLTLTRYAANGYTVADLGPGLGGEGNVYYANVRHNLVDLDLNRCLGRRIAYAPRGSAFLVNAYDATLDVGWEDPPSAWVARATVDGKPVWSPARVELTGVYAAGVIIDSQDRTVLVGDFAQSSSLADDTWTAAAGRDLFLLTLDPNGKRVSARHFEDDHAQWLSFGSIDSEDNVWVAGFSNDGAVAGPAAAPGGTAATRAREIFVHKFSP